MNFDYLKKNELKKYEKIEITMLKMPNEVDFDEMYLKQIKIDEVNDVLKITEDNIIISNHELYYKYKQKNIKQINIIKKEKNTYDEKERYFLKDISKLNIDSKKKQVQLAEEYLKNYKKLHPEEKIILNETLSEYFNISVSTVKRYKAKEYKQKNYYISKKEFTKKVEEELKSEVKLKLEEQLKEEVRNQIINSSFNEIVSEDFTSKNLLLNVINFICETEEEKQLYTSKEITIIMLLKEYLE